VAAYPQSQCHGRVIHHGPRLGVGVVLRGAEPSALEALAWDVCLWEQRACSSPRLLFVEDDARRVAEELVTSLSRMSGRLPPRSLTLDEKSEVLTLRERAWWCDGAEVIAVPGSMSQTLLLVSNLPSAIPVGHRTVIVCPLPVVDDIVDLLAPYRSLLQTVVLAGPAERWPGATALLARAGFTQIAAAGSAASRFLGLPHEGEFALRRLVRLVGVDLGAGPLVYPDRPADTVSRLGRTLAGQ
jgi:phenylacetate-CoA ligase